MGKQITLTFPTNIIATVIVDGIRETFIVPMEEGKMRENNKLYYYEEYTITVDELWELIKDETY